MLYDDPQLLLLPIEGFSCRESIEDDSESECQSDLPVIFHCSLPPSASRVKQYTFGCRKPSFDALSSGEESVEDFDASAVDPNFFDVGYSLAGSTGFCVWAGARFMVESFALSRDRLALPDICGCRVLELGAGVGLLGTMLAGEGAEVLLTDLRTLVDNAISPNLSRNAIDSKVESPRWLCSESDENIVYSIGKGWASAKPLDWSRPVEDQLCDDQLQNIDIVVASDWAWLASMLDMLLDTVASLFRKGASSFFMAFQRREKNVGHALFTTEAHLCETVGKRGWSLSLRAWRPVVLTDKTETVVRLVEIKP